MSTTSSRLSRVDDVIRNVLEFLRVSKYELLTVLKFLDKCGYSYLCYSASNFSICLERTYITGLVVRIEMREQDVSQSLTYNIASWFMREYTTFEKLKREALSAIDELSQRVDELKGKIDDIQYANLKQLVDKISEFLKNFK